MKTNDILSENISIVQPTVHAKEPDHEVQMARSELYRAGKCAMGLHNMLKSVSEQQGLEGWVQAKITKAADYLESVYHYLDYEMKSTGLAEAGPVAPGAVPAGSVTTPGDNTSINGASSGNDQLNQQKAAAAVALQRKQIQDQIRATQKQLQDLQKQLQTIGSIASATAQPKVQESASAGASSAGGIASVGMPMGKKKKEVGSLFGGTYKQNEAANPAQQAAIAISMKKAGKKPKRKEEEFEESANTLFAVKVVDPKTGNEKTIEISALTATEAKSKVAGKTVEVDGEKKHYKVISVKNAWSESKASKQRLDAKCWTGKHKEGTKIKGGIRVNNCVPNESVEEIEEFIDVNKAPENFDVYADSNGSDYDFTVGKTKIEVTFKEYNENYYILAFENTTQRRPDTHAATGTERDTVFGIFNGVAYCLNHFIARHPKTEVIVMGAKSNELSRVKLYDRAAKFFEQMGFKAVTDPVQQKRIFNDDASGYKLYIYKKKNANESVEEGRTGLGGLSTATSRAHQAITKAPTRASPARRW